MWQILRKFKHEARKAACTHMPRHKGNALCFPKLSVGGVFLISGGIFLISEC